MAWPADLNMVQIEGFPRSLLPKIVTAVEKNEIVWLPGGFTMIDVYDGDFEWNGCRFNFVEIQETVHSIKLLEWMCE